MKNALDSAFFSQNLRRSGANPENTNSITGFVFLRRRRTGGSARVPQQSFGMEVIMKIHHIGYLVKKLEKAAAEFKKLGYVPQGEATNDTFRKVDILFLEKDGYVVELVSPNAPDSVVSGLIKTYKNVPYHLCYVCENLDEEITKLTGEGYVQIDLPTPAPAIGGKRVCFLMNRFVGLIELLEQ